MPTLAIPAEHFDHLDVFHVSESGRIYGPSVNNYFPKGELEGLLTAWLNVFKSERIALHCVPKHFEMEVPIVRSDGVRYCKKKINLEAAPFFPIYSEDGQLFDLRWPPRRFPPTVSAEAEIRNCPSQISTRAGDKPDSSETGLALVQFLLSWPKPLDKIMPIASGLDDLSSQASMARIAQDKVRSLLEAQELAAPYLFPGHTTLLLSWFSPTLSEVGMKHLLLMAESKGLVLPRMLRTDWSRIRAEQLLADESWRRVLARLVPMRRAWGAVGLFWALFLDFLETERNFQNCERCGRILLGKHGKRFCGKADDFECFEARRARDKRTLRNRPRA
jgi:hypothetical protein